MAQLRTNCGLFMGAVGICFLAALQILHSPELRPYAKPLAHLF